MLLPLSTRDLLPSALSIDLGISTSSLPIPSSTDELLPSSAVGDLPIMQASSSVSGFYDDLLSGFDGSLPSILASYCLVTAADMVPFVPCQPLAAALGAKLGFALAFPIAAVGQTTAGVLAFTAARRASNSPAAQEALISAKLSSPEAAERLLELRRMTATEEQGETKILLALIGLRLAPFFPFSAGNYLLGGTTSVPLRLFLVATLLGCLLSNFVSVSVGAAAGEAVSSWKIRSFI